MTEMFSTLGTWNWLIFGVLLMALELLAPGVFLFWLGLAALLVGLLSFAIHPSWQMQILMFAIFAACAVPLWRRIASSGKAVSASNPFLNKRADALVGRVFTLEKPIIDGSGTVRMKLCVLCALGLVLTVSVTRTPAPDPQIASLTR